MSDEQRVNRVEMVEAMAFRVGGRRFFTKAAAARHAARQAVYRKYPCDCLPAELGDPLDTPEIGECGRHNPRFTAVIERYARRLRKVPVRWARDTTTTASGLTHVPEASR